MTKNQLLEKLQEAAKNKDKEDRHLQMDRLLLKYVNDERITELFNETDMWYA